MRVRYAETDQMGVVYHANYLIWFEVGRVELMRQLGMDYKSMEQEENALIAVVEATARYKAPARYDDELIVRTSLAGVRGSIVRFRYAVVRAVDEVLLCEGGDGAHCCGAGYEEAGDAGELCGAVCGGDAEGQVVESK